MPSPLLPPWQPSPPASDACFRSIHSDVLSLRPWKLLNPIPASSFSTILGQQNQCPPTSRIIQPYHIGHTALPVHEERCRPNPNGLEEATHCCHTIYPKSFCKGELAELDMSGPAKKRKMNFSELEVEIIVGELERQKHVLISHYNAGVPLLAKTNAWEEILRRVNAVSPCERESSEVKKKWSDMKTEVRRKVAQVRAALEDEAAATPVILTPMQQRICNLLGEATIISLPSAGECTSGLSGLQEPIEAGTTVTLSQIPAETTYHTLDDGVVEYCTTETPTTITTEAPVEITTHHADASSKPQELKSRIALNSAKLLQEQRVTNLHVKEIAQHLEQQNDLLQSIRRSQEIQASAQERQAQAMEGSQATLGALIQLLRPVIKDFRRFLQSNTPSPGSANDANQGGVHGQKNSLIQ